MKSEKIVDLYGTGVAFLLFFLTEEISGYGGRRESLIFVWKRIKFLMTRKYKIYCSGPIYKGTGEKNDRKSFSTTG